MKFTIFNFQFTESRGFIALSTVLVLLAVVSAAIAAVAVLSVGEGQSSLSLTNGEAALQFVEGCTEDALLKARSSATFGDPVGTAVLLSRPEGTCYVTVNSKTGGVWTMTAANFTGSAGPVFFGRTIQVVFNWASSGVTLTSWKEI